MNIDAALEKLKEGKKIRHDSWGKSDFLALDQMNTPRFYTLEALRFMLAPEDLLSDEWFELGSDKSLTFLEALALMQAGKRVRYHHDTIDDCYYELDQVSRLILRLRVVEKPFLIAHNELLSPEWKVLDE